MAAFQFNSCEYDFMFQMKVLKNDFARYNVDDEDDGEGGNGQYMIFSGFKIYSTSLEIKTKTDKIILYPTSPPPFPAIRFRTQSCSKVMLKRPKL